MVNVKERQIKKYVEQEYVKVQQKQQMKHVIYIKQVV